MCIRDSRRGAPVPLNDQVVEVAGRRSVRRGEGVVVDDEEVDPEEFAEFDGEGVVEPGDPEAFEQLVGPFEVNRAAPTDRCVPKGDGEERFADTDRSDDQRVLAGVDLSLIHI